MKRVVSGLVLGMVGLLAQLPSVPFAVGNPPAASVVGVTYNNYVSGAVGGSTYFYWVVTSYAGGSVFFPSFYQVDHVNGSDPSVGHPITVSFNPVQGATGYSVLRTSTLGVPTFPCTCLVGTTSGATYVVDNGSALGAFAPTFITPATGDIRLNNRDYATPVFEQTINGVTSTLGGSGGSAATLSYTAPFTGGVARFQASKNAEVVSIKDFGAVCDGNGNLGTGTDNTAAVLAAVAAVHEGGTVLFPSSQCGTGGYVVGPLGAWTKLVTLDGNGSTIYPRANGVPWLTLGYFSPNGHMQLQNMTLSPFVGFVPTDIVVINGASNAAFDHVVWLGLVASHSVVWHKAAYGVVFRSNQWNSNNAPSTVYFSYQTLGFPTYYTINAKIHDSDFSGVNTGVCISAEGGELAITDTVIESCAGGGIKHIPDDGTGIATNLTLRLAGVHFEGNSLFNIQGVPSLAPNYVREYISADSTTFTVNPTSSGTKSILTLGSLSSLVLTNSQVVGGGCITPTSYDVTNGYSGAAITLTNDVALASSGCATEAFNLISNNFYIIVNWVQTQLVGTPGGFMVYAPRPAIVGTTGNTYCSEPMQGTVKQVSCYLSGYAQTGVAQTYTFPTAFVTTPILQISGGSCGTYNPTTTALAITLPANAGMTAETCNVLVTGQ
jgi:hypothetical protein